MSATATRLTLPGWPCQAGPALEVGSSADAVVAALLACPAIGDYRVAGSRACGRAGAWRR